ncbi:MAG: hypothetical protein H6709_06300 [Kofleriaceae bacterium]|nr:hypothetical protein [Kofleriaceae bacterium]MCB9571686.1 hypothetical protein [Kofleriaceae bacterium]
MRALAGLVLVVGAVALGGCSLFDDLPDKTCKSNADCFTAQGEVCNTATKTCELAPDAGTAAARDLGDDPTATRDDGATDEATR